VFSYTTPFYAESADHRRSRLTVYQKSGDKVADVRTTLSGVPRIEAYPASSRMPDQVGDVFELAVDVSGRSRRGAITNAATHLLHAGSPNGLARM